MVLLWMQIINFKFKDSWKANNANLFLIWELNSRTEKKDRHTKKEKTASQDMEFLNLVQLGGLSTSLFLKSLIPFVFTQKAFFPLDFSSIWLLQKSAEKDS